MSSVRFSRSLLRLGNAARFNIHSPSLHKRFGGSSYWMTYCTQVRAKCYSSKLADMLTFYSDLLYLIKIYLLHLISDNAIVSLWPISLTYTACLSICDI